LFTTKLNLKKFFFKVISFNLPQNCFCVFLNQSKEAYIQSEAINQIKWKNFCFPESFNEEKNKKEK